MTPNSAAGMPNAIAALFANMRETSPTVASAFETLRGIGLTSAAPRLEVRGAWRQRLLIFMWPNVESAHASPKPVNGGSDRRLNEFPLCANQRKAGRSCIFGRAVDKMFGHLDILHELHMRIEME